jgi:PBSX family phage portal protein
MARARLAGDEDDEETWDGFTNGEGDRNEIDDVRLEDEIMPGYKSELKKFVFGQDRFANVPYGMVDRNSRRRLTRKMKKDGAYAKHVTVDQINGYELYELVTPPYNLDHLVELSCENDTHYACIVTKAINIVGLGFKWKERAKVKDARQNVEDDDEAMKKLARKLQRVTDGLDEWIDSLNEDEDFNETLYRVWVDVEATGNGYLEIGRKNNGSIGYVGHIPTATMRIRKDRDGYIQMVQDRLTFFRNFGDTATPDYFGVDPRPNEIIHFRKHSPKNAYYGVPDIIAAMSSVAGEKFASEYNLDYFENKAVPRYALIIKGAKLSAPAERKVLEYFRKEVKGKHHGTLYIPVPAHMGSNVDVQLQAIENKVQEGSFEKYRAGNKESIAMVHRVPKSKLGLTTGVAAAREDDKTFKLQVCQPEQRRVSKKVNRIVKEVTDMYSLEFETYDLLDAETNSRIHDRYIRLGIESPNEVRADLGRHPRRGGDMYVDMAGEVSAKIELTLAQADLAEASVVATEQNKTAPVKAPEGGTGTPGRRRQTTDGSPKNGNSLATPASQTAAAGSQADGGFQEKSTRR